MASRSEPVLAHPGEIVLERVFEAPRALVFEVWTRPEHVDHWWGPKPWTAHGAKIDLRVGGEWLYAMQSPEGVDHWSGGVFLEVVVPERLVYTNHFADGSGKHVPPSYVGMPGDTPIEMLCTATFEELAPRKTRLTLRHQGLPEFLKVPASLGWGTSLDKLAEHLATLR